MQSLKSRPSNEDLKALLQASQLSRVRRRAFDKQRAFIDDSSRLKYAFCSRRAGKTEAIGNDLVETALAFPGSTGMYIGITRERAQSYFWEPILKRINTDYDLGGVTNESRLSVHWPNGSWTYLMGMDANKKQLEKALGGKFKRVVIDEAASYTIDLESLVMEKLRPATVDHLGTIVLAGTPGSFHGYFHRVTNGLVPGWSGHRWSTFDNPHMHEQWTQEIADLTAQNPAFLETPAYKMMYLAEWYEDENAIIYHYDPTKNDFDELPEGKYEYVLAIDLGWRDATAFTVVAYREHDPTLYVVESTKQSEMLLSTVGERIVELREAYGISKLVVDGAAKQSVEELRVRFQLPLVSTQKQGKADVIRMMDTDLRIGRVKLRRGHCDALIQEWGELIWDKNAPREMENQQCKNDAADSALYAFRYARNFLAEPAEEKPNTGPMAAYWERKLRELRNEDDDEIDFDADD